MTQDQIKAAVLYGSDHETHPEVYPPAKPCPYCGQTGHTLCVIRKATP